MTFDEYWNSQARRDEIPNDLLSHDIARAAYEAGAQSRDELLITIHDRLLALDGPGNEPHRHRADFPLEGEYCCICDIRAALKETKP